MTKLCNDFQGQAVKINIFYLPLFPKPTLFVPPNFAY